MSKHVLVIDDDEDIRKSFVLGLEELTYHVDTASSGQEGLEKEKTKHYDLILLDLKMPDMDGTEVLKRIRKRNKEIPIYIVTAFYKEFTDELTPIKKEGLAYEILKKPLSSKQIQLAVKGIIEGSAVY